MRTLPGTATGLTVTALLLAAGCSSTSTGAAKDDAKPAAQSAKQVLTKPDLADKLLFVARSKSATLSIDKDGEGTLQLASVPTMTWFSDRPQHDAGTTKTADALVTFGWKKNGDNLGKAAPNAALTADNLADAVVVELTSATHTGNQLTFTVKALTPEPAGGHPTKLVRADLFIDDVAATRLSQDFVGLIDGVFTGGNAYVGTDGKVAATLTLRTGTEPSPRWSIRLDTRYPVADVHALSMSPSRLRLNTITLVPAIAPVDGVPGAAGYLKVTGTRAGAIVPFEMKLGPIRAAPTG